MKLSKNIFLNVVLIYIYIYNVIICIIEYIIECVSVGTFLYSCADRL